MSVPVPILISAKNFWMLQMSTELCQGCGSSPSLTHDEGARYAHDHHAASFQKVVRCYFLSLEGNCMDYCFPWVSLTGTRHSPKWSIVLAWTVQLLGL